MNRRQCGTVDSGIGREWIGRDELKCAILVDLARVPYGQLSKRWDTTEYYDNACAWGRWGWDTDQLSQSIADEFRLWHIAEDGSYVRFLAERDVKRIVRYCREFILGGSYDVLQRGMGLLPERFMVGNG